MLYKIHDTVLEAALQDPRVRTAFRVLYFFRRHHNYKRDRAPYHRPVTIASHLGCSVRTVERSVSLLVEHGYLELETRKSKTNPLGYRILVTPTTNLTADLTAVLSKPLTSSDKFVEDLRQNCLARPYNDIVMKEGCSARASARENDPTFSDQEEQHLRKTFSSYDELFGDAGTYRLIQRAEDGLVFGAETAFDTLHGEDRYLSRIIKAVGPAKIVNLSAGC